MNADVQLQIVDPWFKETRVMRTATDWIKDTIRMRYDGSEWHLEHGTTTTKKEEDMIYSPQLAIADNKNNSPVVAWMYKTIDLARVLCSPSDAFRLSATCRSRIY